MKKGEVSDRLLGIALRVTNLMSSIDHAKPPVNQIVKRIDNLIEMLGMLRGDLLKGRGHVT